MRSAALAAVRGGYGAVQLAAPALVAGRLLPGPLDRRGRRVARVLGARQLTQSLATASNPTYPVLALRVEVDLMHAASMLGLGLADRRRRRAALTDALVAGSFALAGVLALRGLARPHLAPPAANGLNGVRDRFADRVARRLVPGYRPAAPAATDLAARLTGGNP